MTEPGPVAAKPRIKIELLRDPVAVCLDERGAEVFEFSDVRDAPGLRLLLYLAIDSSQEPDGSAATLRLLTGPRKFTETGLPQRLSCVEGGLGRNGRPYDFRKALRKILRELGPEAQMLFPSRQLLEDRHIGTRADDPFRLRLENVDLDIDILNAAERIAKAIHSGATAADLFETYQKSRLEHAFMQDDTSTDREVRSLLFPISDGLLRLERGLLQRIVERARGDKSDAARVASLRAGHVLARHAVDGFPRLELASAYLETGDGSDLKGRLNALSRFYGLNQSLPTELVRLAKRIELRHLNQRDGPSSALDEPAAEKTATPAEALQELTVVVAGLTDEYYDDDRDDPLHHLQNADWPQEQSRHLAAAEPPIAEQFPLAVEEASALEEMLPIRIRLRDDPAAWQRCLTGDPTVMRVICTLFGGLDQRGAGRSILDWHDLATLMLKEEGARREALERRRSELAARFGDDDCELAIARTLDAMSADWLPDLPGPILDAKWVTRASTPAVQDRVATWLDEAPGERAPLRTLLLRLEASGANAADRAEAAMALLMLDGRPMEPGEPSLHALHSALERTGDALLRSQREFVGAIWSERVVASDAERAAMYRAVLRLSARVLGRPVALAPSPLDLGAVGQSTDHPILLADALARQLFVRGDRAPSEGAAVTALDVPSVPPPQLLAALGWLTTLPHTSTPTVIALWHEAMPDAARCAADLLAPSIRATGRWVGAKSPELGWTFTRMIDRALAVAETDSSGTTERTASGALRMAGTERALRLVARSAHSPASAVALQQKALALLLDEPNEAVMAEILQRMHRYLVRDEPIQRRVRDLVGTVESGVLRGDAADDLGLTARALVDTVGDTVSHAARLAMSIAAALVSEIDRLEPAPPAPTAGGGIGAELAVTDERTLAEAAFLLDEGGVEALFSRRADDAAVGRALSLAVDIDPATMPTLERLAADDQRPRAAEAARGLLALKSSGQPQAWRDLGRVAATGPAPLAARAAFELVGPGSSVGSLERRYQLSRDGLDRWWELGRAACAGASAQRSLWSLALQQWSIDSPQLVEKAAQRADADPAQAAIWRRLLDCPSTWGERAQDALASWLSSDRPDSAAVETCIDLAAMHIETESPPTRSLLDAICDACRARAISVSALPARKPLYRLGAVEAVARACHTALLQDGDRATLDATLDAYRAEWTVTIDAESIPSNLDDYANGLFRPNIVRLSDFEPLVPRDLVCVRAVPLLAAWAMVAEAESSPGCALMPTVTFEAVLLTLAVIAAREPAALGASGSLQALFSRTASSGAWVAAPIALDLLAQLGSLEAFPDEGPGLIDVIDVAARGLPVVRERAFSRLTDLGGVRGAGYATALTEALRTCGNETVWQAIMGLALAYTDSELCPPSDRRHLRGVLEEAVRRDGDALAVYLGGSGSASDPFHVAVGQARRDAHRVARNLDPDG